MKTPKLTIKTPKLFSIKNSIATQLLKSVFSFYLVITILVTSIHLVVEFYDIKKQMDLELQSIGNAFNPGISGALWELDENQLKLILSGVVQFPAVVGVNVFYGSTTIDEKEKEIQYNLGVVEDSDGNVMKSDSFQGSTSLIDYSRLFSQSFLLTHEEERNIEGGIIGKMQIYSSTSILFNKMKLGFWIILINSIIKTAALWILFLLIAQRDLAKPLGELTKIAERLNLDQLENVKVELVTKGRNELKVLEEAFNSMIQKLLRSREELKSQYFQLRQTQDQLVHTEKVAGLGQLIAGVVHEISTPTAAIKGAIEELDRFSQDFSQFMLTLRENLSPEMQTYYYKIESLILSFPPPKLSTREQRKKAKELQKQLDVQQIQGTQNLSKDLAMIGIEEDHIKKLAPLYLTPQVQEIHRSFQQLGMRKLLIRNIKISIDRISQLVKALKSYLHPGSSQPVNSDLRQDLEDILIMFHNYWKQGVVVHKEFEEIPLILCYPSQLSQVWTNLIHNAIQAMQEKGEIFLRLKRWSPDQVAIEIEDIGPGIPEELQIKIFAPYFTTKTKGEGTGLGLTICKQIIQKHNGNFSVESQPGKTCFRVILPIFQSQEEN